MKNFQTLSRTPTVTRSLPDKGDNSFSLGIAQGLSNGFHPRERNPKLREQISQLTTREATVLQLIAEGKANKQAASELCLSIKTVEKHREHLMVKLGIRGTALLTQFAIAAGIIQINPWLGEDGARNRELHQAFR